MMEDMFGFFADVWKDFLQQSPANRVAIAFGVAIPVLGPLLLWVRSLLGLGRKDKIIDGLKNEVRQVSSLKAAAEANLEKEKALTEDWIPFRWLEVADHEARNENFERAVDVLEQGFERTRQAYADVTKWLAEHYMGLMTESALAAREGETFARLSVLLDPEDKDISMMLEHIVMERVGVEEVPPLDLSALKHIPVDPVVAEATIDKIAKRSWALLEAGQYRLALSLSRRGLNIAKRSGVYDEPIGLSIRYSFAMALGFGGKYEAGRNEFQAVYDICKQSDLFGPNHLETLKTRFGLAKQLSGLGEYEAARDELQAVCDIQKRSDVICPDQPDTLTIRFALARAIGDLGEHEAARDELQAVYDIQKRADVFGPEHPNTLITRSDLANQLGCLGEHEAARDELQAVYDIQKRADVLGPEHPNTLLTRSDLANQLGCLGEHEAARDEFQAIYDIQKRASVLGREHQDTLNTLTKLGRYVGKSGDSVQAEEIFDEVSLVYEAATAQSFNPYRRQVLKFYRAELWAAQGRIEAAHQALTELLPDLRARFKPTHCLIREAEALLSSLPE